MKVRILFLCTHNSCRSQMAEGLANHFLSDSVQAFSAGTEATQVNPLAIKVLAELGIDCSGLSSKSLDEFDGQSFDHVITLCGDANEKCPLFFGGVHRLHHGFDDPSRLIGSDDDLLPEFRRVRDDIKAWVIKRFGKQRERMIKCEDKIKRLAIFSVSAGSGHVRAAQALQAAAAEWYPDIEVVHIDLMELVPKLFRIIYAETYITMIEQHPALWGYLYDRTDREKFDSSLSRLRSSIENINTRKLKNVLQDIAPDHVICTHFLPAQLLSRRIRKGKFHKPVWVQVTDFDVHALWIHNGLSGYFAAHDELAWRMSARGIPADVIHVTGIPIMPVFTGSLSREECSRELGLDPARKTLLMMSGGAGLGDSALLAERLINMNGEFQIVILAGKNEKQLKKLKIMAARYPGKLFPIGFINTIERVMAASDLAISKPGGLTTSECLAMGLPMIIVSPIPGQEERNADFLLEQGVALKACDDNAVVWRVNLLFNQPERLQQMSEKARIIGRPDSARQVLEYVLGKTSGERS